MNASLKKTLQILAIGGVIAGTVVVTPSGAVAAPASSCGITWGSLPKSEGAMSTAPLTNVRAGRHECYDRVVMDIRGPRAGFQVSYVSAVHDQAGAVVALRGGAFLQIDLLDPAYDAGGHATYNPANPRELANLSGYQTFRQLAYGGTFEGYTTVGLGLRARLPFRAFTLAGPAGTTRVVVDVAHRW